jgi:pimeloyl-ACP methyl ester carboxylesterase
MAGEIRTVESADGAEIHTVSLGAGDRTVVLAHGYGLGHAEWNLVGSMLAERGFRVVAFDQRGHGRSTIGRDGVGSMQMSSDYAAVLDAYDASHCVLVGHSMGGFLALAFLLESGLSATSRVGSLFLMATFAGDVLRNNAQNRLQIPLIKSGVLQRMLGLSFVRTVFTKSLAGDGFEAGMADAFAPGFLANDHQRLIPILKAMGDENRYGQLNRLDLPCTIVVGSRDKTTPPFHTTDLHAGIEGSQLVTLDGMGHLLNWEAPERIVDEIVGLAGR